MRPRGLRASWKKVSNTYATEIGSPPRMQEKVDAITEDLAASALPDRVCPRCSDGRPICRDTRPDGTRYTHEETCATYDWADDVCAACQPFLELDTSGPPP